MAEKDERIAYGACCVWWDSIDKTGKLPSGLPCCPHCNGVLFEMENEAAWMEGVDKYEQDGHPDYRKMILWTRGKCFASLDVAKAEWEREVKHE